MDGVVEIITGRECHRRWGAQNRLRIVTETHEPGGDVAARHGVCASLVFAWRRQVHQEVLAAAEVPTFVPAWMLKPATTAVAAPGVALIKPDSGLVETGCG